jgi:site-specific recombinase XerD
MAGVDLVTVKELLGHETINMTNRYPYLAQKHKSLAVAKLTERFESQAIAAQAR